MRHTMTLQQPVTRVRMTARAVRTITTELAANDHDTETGGILLGRHDRDTVVVRHAGTPGPAAVRTPTSFLRDLAHAQALADQAFADDGSTWVGEWHTHPTSATTTPSPRDASTYRRLLRDPELAFHTLIAVILAPHRDSWAVQAWACRHHRITDTQLQLPVHLMSPTDHRDRGGPP
ncbi:Mov34/MPN/PAD-1 family protein [Streptomyces xylophagus]|uniref:Mov34/MPN/PAD-1 family protein n=1 Tax=Streptomyces xylophagus TaxID=285514 RepID=UPI000AFA8580|nr:Mov34/MPN/PAD-1 family protein [Streptomyces xylophagus]